MDFHGSRFCMGIPPNHFAFWKTMLTIYRQLFNLFICWFVCPPKLSTCATCALRSNLVAWRSLRKHGTPMRTFQAYQPALHLFSFFCSKRFEVLKFSAWFAQVTMLHLQHILKAVRQLREMKHIEVHMLLYLHTGFPVCYIYLLILLWCVQCIHRHDILIVLTIQPSVWCFFHYCNRWWVRWMPGGHRDSARTEGQKHARTQSSCFMTGHAPPPGGFRQGGDDWKTIWRNLWMPSSTWLLRRIRVLRYGS